MINIFVKYRCMTCPGTPWLNPPEEGSDEEYAIEHLTENVGHELAQRVSSEELEDE